MGGKVVVGPAGRGVPFVGPMFKETGFAAMSPQHWSFLFVQPSAQEQELETYRRRHRPDSHWRSAGHRAGTGMDSAPWVPCNIHPYVQSPLFAWQKAKGLLRPARPAPARPQDSNRPAAPAVAAGSGEIPDRTVTTLHEQAARILRWYLVLILPISLALLSVMLRSVRTTHVTIPQAVG